MRALADALDAGLVDTAEAAKQLRELATFRPAPNCTRMVSYSRWLARVDETWQWSVVVDTQSWGPRAARLISNRYTRHESQLDTVIDFTWWEPADIDTFGRAICEVAATVQARRDTDGEED